MKDILNSIIRNRRSVYPDQYNGKVISDEVIKEILINANTAPTHRMTQPWFFKVFSQNSKLKLVNEIINLKSDQKMSESAKNSLITKFQLTSHIICICMNRDVKNTIPEWEELAAVSMSVQNMWLTCTAYKLGCYWSSPNVIHQLDKFLDLKSNQKCLGFFYIGQYDNLPERNLKREKLDDKVQWI
jgi:nitroreductase